MQFRKLQACEFDKLRELFGDDPDNLWPKYRKQRLEQFVKGDAEAYVVDNDGRIVGEITATFVNGDLEQETIPRVRVYLQAFRVLPDFQGQGLGTKLLQFVVNELRSRGYTEFTIGVEENNSIARHIYEKLGFVDKIAHGKGGELDPSEYDLYLLKVI